MLEASRRHNTPIGLALLVATAVVACEQASSDELSHGGSGAASSPSGSAGAAGGGVGNSSGGGGNPGAAGGGLAGGTAAGSTAAGTGGNGGGSGGSDSSGGSAAGGVGGASGGAANVAGGGAAAGNASAGSGGASGARTYSSDPSTFGGASRCQGFAVCESFETTAVGALPSEFTLQGYGNRVVGASADRAMRGARSLKFQVEPQAAVTAWLTRSSLGPLGAQHFGRSFVRIESPAPTEFVHFDLLEASGPYQGHTNNVRYASTGTGVGTQPSNWSFIYNVQPSGNGAGAEFGTEGGRSAHPRVDDWMCLEWSFDASQQVAQYYLDGAAIDYLRIDTERAEIPVFDTIAVGFGKYQNTGAFLVYIDEIAFDAERIGCNN